MSDLQQIVGRFLRAWLAYACASALAGILMLVQYWILEGLWPSDGDDMPPVLAIFESVTLWGIGLLLGLVVAGFRGFVVGPKPPFFRWGYVAVAALQLLLTRMHWGDWNPAFLIDGQILLLLTMLLFVWLGRRSGVLDGAETPPEGQRQGPQQDAA